MASNIVKIDEEKLNSFIKDNVNSISQKMVENSNKLVDEFKILNGELKELMEIENELKHKEALNLNKKNELVNLERKLNDNNIENSE